MEPANPDQQKLDEDVNRVGKRIVGTAAGVGIVAALIMSTLALSRSTATTRVTMPMHSAVAARPSGPRTASIMIDHVTRGCHTLDVNGSRRLSPTATLHLAAGGSLHVQNNDVMPHELVALRGPQPSFVTPAMSHMGAKSTVTFAKPGTYRLTTKPGEDYVKGVKTVGPDNTLRITVVVA